MIPKTDMKNMTDLLRGGRIESKNALAKRRLNCFGVVLEKRSKGGDEDSNFVFIEEMKN